MGKEATFVTKLSRQTNLKIPYRTNNSTEHTLKPTEPNFKYKEHHLSFRNNNTSSKFTQHLTEDGHTLGPVDSIMDILSFNRKGIQLDTTERIYIYREATVNNQFNGKHTICSNKILKTITSMKGHWYIPTLHLHISTLLNPSLLTIAHHPSPPHISHYLDPPYRRPHLFKPQQLQAEGCTSWILDTFLLSDLSMR